MTTTTQGTDEMQATEMSARAICIRCTHVVRGFGFECASKRAVVRTPDYVLGVVEVSRARCREMNPHGKCPYFAAPIEEPTE